MTDLLAPIDDDIPELLPRDGNGGDGGGGMMMPAETKIGDVVSMRRAARLMPRQPKRIRLIIAETAEMFGDEWEYRFPVKNNKTNQTDWIEGATIGCTMAVARAYGNCDVAHTRTEDDGPAWILYSTFLDLESGFTLTRGFRQRKGQSRMGSDRARGEDIDFQIGVSKSTRNVVARALDDYVRYARQCARQRLTGSIAKRAGEYRDRIKAYLAENEYPLASVEGALGAKIDNWSHEQIATVVRTLAAHKDGILGDLDSVYEPKPMGEAAPEEGPQPRQEPQEEARPVAEPQTSAEPAAPAPGPAAGPDDGFSVMINGVVRRQRKRAADDLLEMLRHDCHSVAEIDELMGSYGEVIGQLGKYAAEVETEAETQRAKYLEQDQAGQPNDDEPQPADAAVKSDEYAPQDETEQEDEDPGPPYYSMRAPNGSVLGSYSPSIWLKNMRDMVRARPAFRDALALQNRTFLLQIKQNHEELAEQAEELQALLEG
jgi:hypothetical protein